MGDFNPLTWIREALGIAKDRTEHAKAKLELEELRKRADRREDLGIVTGATLEEMAEYDPRQAEIQRKGRQWIRETANKEPAEMRPTVSSGCGCAIWVVVITTVMLVLLYLGILN